MRYYLYGSEFSKVIPKLITDSKIIFILKYPVLISVVADYQLKKN